MKSQSQEQTQLPTQWAFVVQFSAETDVAQEHFAGRVEHVVTGQTTHFHTQEDLMAFLTRMLATVRLDSCQEP